MIAFSIIIPVRNRAEEIRRCVASCYAVDFDPTLYEVIVVDNGSTDLTARAASQAGARVISEPTPNRCLARNAGARVARGPWLLFTDSDCEADPGWLAAMDEAKMDLERQGLVKVALLAGRIDPAPPQTGVEVYIAERKWIDQEKFLSEGRRYSPPFAATANLAVRADLFNELGGFDPVLSVAGEDADFCWRAAWAGGSIRYVPDARVVHHHRATRAEMIRQAYNYGLGNADLFAKHRERWNASKWIERERYVWALKGLLKIPWTALAAREPKRRWFSCYDFLANFAQARGRRAGGKKHRLRII
jgi:GT2 family glycosyltransferase